MSNIALQPDGTYKVTGPPMLQPGQEEYLPNGTLNPNHPGFQNLTQNQLQTGNLNNNTSSQYSPQSLRFGITDGSNVGYKPPTMPAQNQWLSPFQNTQYNPLTPYNFMSIGGQGSMNQFNPFQNNDPAGGTMMNQSQGFYSSLPNYGFYQR